MGLNKRSITFLILCGFFGFFIFSAIVAYAPHNPLKTYLLIKEPTFKRVFTQGWNFFTRNPRETEYRLFKKDDTRWIQATRFPNSEFKNLVGLSRKSRAQGLELGIVRSAVTKNELNWDSTRSSLDKIDLDPSPQLEIENFTPNPTICGNILVVKVDRIPWAWAQSIDFDSQPKEYVMTAVNCSQTH